MNTTEFRIGNLISYRGEKECEVDNLGHRFCTIDLINGLQNGSDDLRDYEPIPLTEERLLKFGFKNCLPELRLNGFIMEKFYDGYHYTGGEGVIYGVPIQYVHQLQNLCFALTNKELTMR